MPVPAHPHLVDFDSAGERARARVWALVQRCLFRTSFHNAYKWRNALLRAFGAKIDGTVRIRPSCEIDRPWNLSMARKSALGDGVVIYAGGPVTIGERSVISQFTIIAAVSDAGGPGSGPATGPATGPAIGPRGAAVSIGSDCWIAAESFVPGGTVVPEGVVVGARSVLSAAGLEAWTIASGDPAVSRRARAYQGRASA